MRYRNSLLNWYSASQTQGSDMRLRLLVLATWAFAVLAFGTTGKADPDEKVNLCHRLGHGEYIFIVVSSNAELPHRAHGDLDDDGVFCATYNP